MYILLNTFEQKMVCSPIFKPKVAKPPAISVVFVIFVWLGAYLPPLTLSQAAYLEALNPRHVGRLAQQK